MKLVSVKFDAHGAWTLLPLSSGQLYHSWNHEGHAAKCVAQQAYSNTITISALTGPHLYSWVKSSNYS